MNASTSIPNSPFLMSAPGASRPARRPGRWSTHHVVSRLIEHHGTDRTIEQCEESPIARAFVALRRTLSYASSPGVTCCDDKNRSIPTAPRGVNAHGSLFSSVFLERARGLRRRCVHVRRSHGHVLDRALQQLGHRSIPYPKNLGRVRLQSQDLRVHAKDVQRRSTSVVGLVAGSSSAGLGHTAGQLQCSTAKSTVAQEIGLPTSAQNGRVARCGRARQRIARARAATTVGVPEPTPQSLAVRHISDARKS